MIPFFPATGLSNPHTQTLAPRLFRKRPLFQPIWDRYELTDGDFIDLAWSSLAAQTNTEKPLMILFHGLEGSFYSPYANGIMKAFVDQGWHAVVMHFRGCSGEINRLARAYHSGEIGDATWLLDLLDKRDPSQTKVAVGISLGGNMLVNYLAHQQNHAKLNAAAVISAPLDLAACSWRIEQGFSKVYHQYLLGSLKRNALQKAELIENTLGIDGASIKRIQRLWEFDDKLTAPLHGFDGAKDYYSRCSGLGKLDRIKTPTLIVHAKDDPFMTSDVIPNFELPSCIDYQLLTHGGHVGFVSGSLLRPKMWLEEMLPSYFSGHLK